MNARGQYGTRVAGPTPIDPLFAGMRRAVHAIFGLYNRVRAPFYIYAEVNGIINMSPAYSLDEANARSAAIERSIGEVYVAVFDTTDARWPDPAYQNYIAPPRARRASVGADGGSILPRTPGDTEDELDQLHGEIMQYGQEVEQQISRTVASNPEVQRLRALEQVASAILASMQTIPVGAAVRIDAANKAKAATARRQEAELSATVKSPVLDWRRTTWKPFLDEWIGWRAQKKDIPLQMWPLSGVWDRIQDERSKFIDIRSKAPFKATGPTPIDPRKDPSLTGFLGDAGKFVKWGLIGALGIGAVVALSSVAHNLKSGTDPAEKYMEVIRRRRPRELAAPRVRLALPPGEPA